jgi:hypothetical protein
MLVMPSNWAKSVVHYWAGRFPGRLGHLYSPAGGFKGPYPWLPYALDNGAFPAWTNGTPWDADAFLRILDRAAAAAQPPIWVAAPDVVADRAATLDRWAEWAPRLRAYGWPLAFVVQDGMTDADVPADAEVIFVGGTTRWKRQSIPSWCRAHRRVHVGRINTERWLWYCQHHGAESCDGTGWGRGDQVQLAGLERYLERSSAGMGPATGHQGELFIGAAA